MKLPSGLEVLEERGGSGPAAKIGDTVIYNVRIFLNRGDEVPMNEKQLTQGISPTESDRKGIRWSLTTLRNSAHAKSSQALKRL